MGDFADRCFVAAGVPEPSAGIELAVHRIKPENSRS
jgi:O-phosphoseryl-tRNA(Cys) synthetase